MHNIKKAKKYVSKNISHSIKSYYNIGSNIFCIYDFVYIDFRFTLIFGEYKL